jgi:hypothetical protein
MIYRTGVLAGFLAVFGTAASAQDIRLPLLGVFADRGRLVPVRGVPGALTFGVPAAVPAGFRLLAATADGRSAVGVLDTGRAAILRAGTDALSPLNGVDEGGKSAILSPHGSAAALCMPGSNRVQIVDLNTQTARPSFLSACPEAVSDDGQAVWVRSARLTEAIRVQPGADTQYESFGGSLDAIAILPRSQDAVVAAAGELWLVGSGRRERLASGIGTPIFLTAAISGKRMLLVFGNGAFEVRSVAGELLTTGSCGCEPALIEPTAVADIFWLARHAGRAAVLLDLRERKPATWLVPAAEVEVRN